MKKTVLLFLCATVASLTVTAQTNAPAKKPVARGGDTTISFSRSRNLVKRFESVKGFRARHDQISSFLERSLSRATQAIGQGSLGSFRTLLRVAWRNNPSMAWIEHER